MKFNYYILITITFLLTACFSNNKTTLPSNQSLKPQFYNNEYLNNSNSNYNKYATFKDWYLLQSNKSGCALISYPISSYGDYFDRASHYFYLTYNKKNKNYEIAIIGGGLYKANSTVNLEINEYIFSLPTLQNQAWSNNETLLINEMLKSNTTWLFTENYLLEYKVIDKYSLNGFQEALNHFNKTCI